MTAPIDASARVRADAISALVVALDTKGRIVLWNHACELLTGYAADEAIGRQVWDFLVPDDTVEPVKRVFGDLVGEKLPSRFENAWVTRDGQLRWILWSNTFEAGPDGAEGLVVSTGVDITDHLQTEDRLAISEAAVRELYEAAAGPGRSSDARISALLEMGRRRFGMDVAIVARIQGERYEVVAVEGGAGAGIRTGDVFDLTDTYCSVTLRAGGPVCFESASSTGWGRHPCFGKTGLEAYIAVPLRTGDHPYGTLSFSSLRPRPRPFLPADCDLIRLMGQWLGSELGRSRASRDAAVLAETAGILALSLDQAETARQVARIVAESCGDICMVDVLDEEGAIQRTAAAAAPAHAGLAEELTGRRVDRGRPYITRDAIERGQCGLLTNAGEPELRSLVAGGAELRLLHRLAPGSLMTVPLVARGHVHGALAVVRGRGRMPLDHDDARLVDQLAQRAALALDNARLYETATSAIRLRDEITGVVAHDLRNPLTGIMLVADVLSRSADPEKTQAGMAKIRRAGERMDRLIQDLLDVTRLEAGALRIEPERVAIEPVIAEALDVLKPLAAAGSVSIETVMDGPVPAVLADRGRLLQVLGNVAGNAVKFTPPDGRIAVAVRVRGRTLEISISDTGPGIGPEEIEHVFDRFWRGRTKEQHGAGLGLAIAKGIVEAHGGRIWVRSVVGQGSTFTLALPLADAADDDLIDLPIDARALDSPRAAIAASPTH